MRFWKEHVSLRMGLIAAFFLAGLVLVVAGWKMTGTLSGLGVMLLGVVLLLAALMIYNKPFEEPRNKKS